ncbi:MAG: biotin--[acetyl-CoA-carboxylase] ligase [Alphaproteobacteria bacterium]|nr:biotin--[acetyl-CoA-carboxylase] ligase [Alphaproteobacteria bacterium]
MTAAEFTTVWPVLRFDAIDSTNSEARRRAEGGDFGSCWLSAARQTAGRGRLGRSWDSPVGNLSATALFRFAGSPVDAALACFAAGLAVIDAVNAAGVDSSGLRLKWPNDVLLGEAKVAGILIETGGRAGALWMAAGFGVNIAVAPKREDRETASLGELPGGAGLTPERYLSLLDAAFRSRMARLVADGFGPMRADWLSRAAHIGRRVELTPATGRIEGIVRDLAADGALVLELPDGSLHNVRAGEISVLS